MADDTKNGEDLAIDPIDMLGDLPVDSGFYWIKLGDDNFGQIGFLHADDMDDGSRWVHFFNGMRMHDGHGRFINSQWVRMADPFCSPNVEDEDR